MKVRLPLLYSILSALIIGLWCVVYRVSGAIAVGHIVVLTCLHFTIIGGISLLHKYPKVGLFLTAYYAMKWVWFYLLIFGSMHFWGDIITLPMICTYLLDLPSFFHSLPYHSTTLYELVALVCVIPFGIVYLLRHPIGRALSDYHHLILSHRTRLLLLGFLLLLATPLLLRGKRIIHKSGEPLMVMLFDHMWGVTDNPLFTPHRATVAAADRASRAAFRPSASTRKNVILIIVDALRADHLSLYGYPRATSPYLQQLFDSHHIVKVDHCFATCACTLCGVPSILLSREWEDCAIGDWSIVGLMRDYGFHTYTYISGAHKEWYNMAKFYSDDCTSYWDGKMSSQYYFKDDRVLLEGLTHTPDADSTPAFMYFHLQSTHETGLLLDTYAIYKPYKRSLTATHLGSTEAINEYDNKVVQADATIHQLMELLARKGYLRNAIVVITADHGQGLGEHGISGHVDWLYEPQVSVPLLFFDDSIFYYRQLHIARQIDIAPTIADRLGMQIPTAWQGQSLLHDTIATISYHSTGKTQLETRVEKYAQIWYAPPHIYKYIYPHNRTREELYDIATDSLELHDLSLTRVDVITQMRALRRRSNN